MLLKIVSLSLVALGAGQVQIEGSPEWQAWKNAELAFIAPSVGPTPGNNFAQSQLNWQHAQAVHQQQAAAFVAGQGRKKRQAASNWQASFVAGHGQQNWQNTFVAGHGQQNWQNAFVAGQGRKKRQVSVVGSPEWQAWKNAELAFIAPSVGPTPSNNFAQSQLNYQHAAAVHQQNAAAFVASQGRKKRQVSVVGSPEWQAWKQAELEFIAPSVGPTPGNNYAQSQLNYQHAAAVHQQNAAAFVAGQGRKKRQVSVVGSPEWQAWKQAELAYIAPSPGPTPINYAQSQLNYQHAAAAYQQNAAAAVAGHGRRKRQVQVEGSPEWQAWKNAELAFIAPSVGPTPINHAQSELNYIAPSPGPTPVNYAQSQLNYQQAALNFVARG